MFIFILSRNGEVIVSPQLEVQTPGVQIVVKVDLNKPYISNLSKQETEGIIT